MLRITECLVSAACGVYLLVQSQVVPNHLLWVYVPTGVGGIILTYLLFVSRLVPRPIALLGLVGYVVLTIGVPLDLLGLLDMSEGAGLLLVVPGGLFELVFLPGLADHQGIQRAALRRHGDDLTANTHTPATLTSTLVRWRTWTRSRLGSGRSSIRTGMSSRKRPSTAFLRCAGPDPAVTTTSQP